jgi:hypothetical protein
MSDISVAHDSWAWSGNGSPSTRTLSIIILLLGLIVVVMIYNYWVIYSYPRILGPNSELFVSTTTENAKTNTRIPRTAGFGERAITGCTDSPGNQTLCPIVQSVVAQASGYPVGQMSQELKKYYDENPRNPGSRNPGSRNPGSMNPGTMNGPTKKVSVKSDRPEKGIMKLAIYHMKNCGHCQDIMENKQENGKTKFENLKAIFNDQGNVQILDFQYGRDQEAGQFNAFPTIHIITENGTVPYNGPRDVMAMARALSPASPGTGT